MSNEENMREEFAAYWDRDTTDEEFIFADVFGDGAKRRAAMAFYAATKAGAAIKDAEIAKLQKHNQDLRANALANEQANYDQVAKLVNEIAARDLMIKELREAVFHFEHPSNMSIDNRMESSRKLKEALAKSEHYNSRALEKKLLEVEFSVLCAAYDCCKPYGVEFHHMIEERRAKLAELNKE